jgi:tyrosinase
MATAVARPEQPTARLRFRRSAARLTAGQLQLLRDGFQGLYAIADDRGCGYHAGIHGLPLPIGCDNGHGTPYFLPWHRAYLYFFERALRDRVPGAMLAWWDWRSDAGRPGRIPEAFSAARADGKPNPLAAADVPREALAQGRQAGLRVGRRTRRQPGNPSALPSYDDVEQALGGETSSMSARPPRSSTTASTSGSEAT